MPGILNYRYENMISAQTIRVPKLPAKDLQAFQATTFEKVGLQGPPTGVSLMEWSFDSAFLATKCE
jgi:hypothetical protein